MIKQDVFIVPGIRSRNRWNDFPLSVAPFFESNKNYDVNTIDIGYVYAIQARFKNKGIAKKLMTVIPDDSIFIGHSNAAVIAYMMSKMGKKFRGVVLVNPALDRSFGFESADFVHVYYNKGDKITDWSRLLYNHPWGSMGRYGPSYTNRKLRAFDCGNTPLMPVVSGHSDIYTNYANRHYWIRDFMTHRISLEL